MASEDRGTKHPIDDGPLVRLLESQGSRFDFFKAVHLIQSAFPAASRVGAQGPAEEERIRFRTELSLSFPTSDIARIQAVEQAGAKGHRFEITTSFLGLYGSSSPLPAFYTEDLLAQDPDESLAREFLDLFHHRLLSLFYRVWEKYCYTARFQKGGNDPISKDLLCLSGLSPELAAEDPRIPPVRLLAYAGLLSQAPRSARNLRGIIADYFPAVPVEVEQCVEQTLRIEPEEENRLGVQRTTLGEDLSVGDRVVDQSSTFRIKMGPMMHETFKTFLPSGSNTAQLEELVGVFNLDALDFELELWIGSEEIPQLKLSGETANLGWSAWLGSRPGNDQSVRFLFKESTHGQR